MSSKLDAQFSGWANRVRGKWVVQVGRRTFERHLEAFAKRHLISVFELYALLYYWMNMFESPVLLYVSSGWGNLKDLGIGLSLMLLVKGFSVFELMSRTALGLVDSLSICSNRCISCWMISSLGSSCSKRSSLGGTLSSECWQCSGSVGPTSSGWQPADIVTFVLSQEFNAWDSGHVRFPMATSPIGIRKYR